MKHILQLGFGTQGLRYFEEANNLGCFISATDQSKFMSWKSSVKYTDLINNFIEHTNFYSETFFEIILKAHNQKRLDAILPLADGHVFPAAIMQHHLKLKGPGLLAATISTNKAYQRLFFSLNNILMPEFITISLNNYQEVINKTQFPRILKPINMFGSIGVKLVHDKNEAMEHAEELLKNYESILLEEFIDGPEFSVESLVQNGKIIFTNITQKYTGPHPYFLEIGHAVPFLGLSESQKKNIEEYNRKIIETMNVQDSIVHLEARIAKGNTYLMEVATRTPGDRIMDLIEVSTGVNLYKAVVDIALGNEVELPVISNEKISYIHWFTSKEEGVIESYKGLPYLMELPQVVAIEMIKKEGDIIEPSSSSFNRLGFCLLELSSEEEIKFYNENLDDIIDVKISIKN